MKPLGSQTSLVSFSTILDKADISAGLSLADLGCGNAVFFLHKLLEKAGKDGEVYGIDIQEEIIDTAQRELRHHAIEGITLLRGDLDKPKGTELENEQLDRAFLINTLHQSSDIISMLREAKRMLKNNGRLIIVDWDLIPSPLGPHQDRRISPESVKEAAELCGFNLQEGFKPGIYHYGLVLAKNN